MSLGPARPDEHATGGGCVKEAAGRLHGGSESGRMRSLLFLAGERLKRVLAFQHTHTAPSMKRQTQKRKKGPHPLLSSPNLPAPQHPSLSTSSFLPCGGSEGPSSLLLPHPTLPLSFQQRPRDLFLGHGRHLGQRLLAQGQLALRARHGHPGRDGGRVRLQDEAACVRVCVLRCV